MKHFMKPKYFAPDVKKKTIKDNKTKKLEDRIDVAVEALTGS